MRHTGTVHGAMRGLRGALLALCLWSGPGQADPVPRVVSMNLCTDQWALLLADPDQILSLTNLATDPRSSPMAELAAGYPQNAGRAEQIMALAPDLVLADVYSDRATVDMLRRLGVRVEQMSAPTALEQIPAQIRTAGALLGQSDRAEAMAARAEAQLADLRGPGVDAPVAAFFYPNGYSLGAGTLAHDIVTAAGLRNLAQALGMTGGGTLSLEHLVMQAPDVLIAAPRYPGHSRSEALAFHPALDRYRAADRMIYSSADWVCGTPHALRAVDAVAAAVADMDRAARP